MRIYQTVEYTARSGRTSNYIILEAIQTNTRGVMLHLSSIDRSFDFKVPVDQVRGYDPSFIYSQAPQKTDPFSSLIVGLQDPTPNPIRDYEPKTAPLQKTINPPRSTQNLTVGENSTPPVLKKLELKLKDGITLYPHQPQAVLHLMNTERAYLGDEMGLGKTISAIVAADQVEASRVCVICPASLQRNWYKEIYKISLNPNRWSVHSYGKIPDELTEDSILILDEAHYIKNITSQRTQKIARLVTSPEQRNELGRKAENPNYKPVKRFWLLSGTPLTKSAQDAYVPLALCGKETLSRNGFWRFQWQFCNSYKDKFGTKFSGVKNEQYLKRVMNRYYFGRRKTEVLDLPEKIKTVHSVAIDKKLAQESAVLFEKLEAGTITFDERGNFAKARQAIGLSKVKHGLEFLKEQFQDEDDSLVLFAYHKSVIALLEENLPGAVTLTGDTPIDKRQTIVDDFQAGKFRILILNIIAGGVGITLTKAQNAIFFEVDVTPANNLQAEDRIHRIGQTGTCNIYYLCAENSVDERVFKLLEYKTKQINKVMK